MKAAIRQRALELGFDDCRVTTAEPPESAGYFLDWLKDQRHGSMGWLERNAHKRVEPQLVLENARSGITLAASYGSASEENETANRGIIARYARYNEYHDTLGQALGQLTESVRWPARARDHSGTWIPARCLSATLANAPGWGLSANTRT